MYGGFEHLLLVCGQETKSFKRLLCKENMFFAEESKSASGWSNPTSV